MPSSKQHDGRTAGATGAAAVVAEEEEEEEEREIADNNNNNNHNEIRGGIALIPTQASNTTTNNNNNVAVTTSESSSLNLLIGFVIFFGTFMVIMGRFIMILIFVIFGLYLRSSIPPIESFDVRKEMARIKRGKHLPEGHPQRKEKPKTWLGKKLLTAKTAVETNLTNAIHGYDVHFVNFGILTMAVVHDKTQPIGSDNPHCWAGFCGQWRYELGQTLARFSKTLNSTLQQQQQQQQQQQHYQQASQNEVV